jgi:hypothetical protein
VRALERKVNRDSARLVEYEQSTFYLYKYIQPHDSVAPKLKLGAYVDGYFAWYGDSAGGEFSKFPTVAPRSGQFGLNMLYCSATYAGEKARCNIGLQFGDIPLSSWDPKLSMIQEANAGLRLQRRIWLDAGFFRSHIGMESIQPRENITSSLAVTTYFEPYFMSGAKLSYLASAKVTLQLQVLNGFNNFIDNNIGKAIGASIIYAIGPKAALTFNTIYSDDSPDSLSYFKRRWYNDAYFVYRGDRLELGVEANCGLQQNSDLQDSTHSALMYSATLVAKYKWGRFALYARGELFEDRNEMLTGPITDANHQLVGINLWGATLGTEFKPLPNSFLRLESRYLQTSPDEAIFYRSGYYYNYRVEVISSLGVWF